MFLEKLFRKKDKDQDVKVIKEYVEMINQREEMAVQELKKISELLSEMAKETGKQ